MSSAHAQDCRPTKIVDGDTFHFRPADADVIKVRIVGFDAPERGQPFGIDPRFVKDESAQDQKAHSEALMHAQTEKIGMWSIPDSICGKEFREQKNARK